MSGGGGGWRSRGTNALSLQELYDRAQRRTDEATYNAEVEGILQDALSEFNNRDTDKINQHLETIKDALSKEIEGSVDLKFGGSIIKHTYVNGLSDVDMLACLNNTSLEGKSPTEVLDFFAQRLQERFPRTQMKVGDLAVTVTFSDGHQIQLLPAVKMASGYRIATSGGQQWSNVLNPARFARKLTDVNQVQGGKVVPVIKLYKAMNDTLPKPSRLSGYHIESLAIEAFKNYQGQHTLKQMLQHFCAQAKNEVMHPISDSTGQSRHVDDYLGAAHGNLRQQVSRAIGNIEQKLTHADSTTSVHTWQEMVS